MLVRNSILGDLAVADFAVEYAPISEEQVYLDAEHWETHLWLPISLTYAAMVSFAEVDIKPVPEKCGPNNVASRPLPQGVDVMRLALHCPSGNSLRPSLRLGDRRFRERSSTV